MPKDYYLVLGIPSDASLDDIKEAYRRLAKAYHPDHYGDQASPFLAIQEAYSVLSDPIRRQTHDLDLMAKKKHSRQPLPVRPVHRYTRPEPLIPEPEPLTGFREVFPDPGLHLQPKRFRRQVHLICPWGSVHTIHRLFWTLGP